MQEVTGTPVDALALYPPPKNFHCWCLAEDISATLSDDVELCMLSDAGDAGAFPSLPKFPHMMITSLLDAVKYGSHEARLLFPRLLQIVALYPDTINNFISTVCASCLFITYSKQASLSSIGC